MRLLISLFASLVKVSIAAEHKPDVEPLPLGVPYNRGPLYRRSFEFACLDGSKTILYTQVNDDYCDCPDGSDEPGTSACPNGKFYCANKGHIGAFIVSSRVNDRICDCCDGSDEYSGAVECPNICEELGQSAREEMKRQAEIARKGFAARKVLATEGQKLREQKLAALAPLKEEREKLLPLKEDLLNKKNLATEKEKSLKAKHEEVWKALRDERKKARSDMLFKEIDTNGDKKITLDELKKLEYLDSNHDGVVSDEEAKSHLTVDEADAEHFLNNMYENIEREKKEAEDYKMHVDQKEDYDDLYSEEARREDPDETTTVQSEAAVETTTGQIEPPVETTTPVIPREAKNLDNDTDKVEPPYDDETQRAIKEAEAAQKAYDEIDLKVSKLDSEIREAESFTEQDFGSDHSWATLKGKCFELTEKQYTYKLCLFDRTIQKEKGGYSEISLGNWKEWSGSPDKYAKQSYNNGQQCWNGPERSTEVVVECGEDSELVEATEPAKCEYRFVFRTPVACGNPDEEAPQHMEL